MTKANTPTTGHNSDAEPKTIRELAKAWAIKDTQGNSCMLALVQTIREKKGTVEMLKDKTSDLRQDVDEGIIDHFKQAAKKLVRLNKGLAKMLPATPPAGTPPSQDFVSKQGRKYWQQQVSSYRAKIVKGMAPKKTALPGTRKNDNQWFTDWLNDGLKRAKSSETLMVDVEELTAWLGKCPIKK